MVKLTPQAIYGDKKPEYKIAKQNSTVVENVRPRSEISKGMKIQPVEPKMATM